MQNIYDKFPKDNPIWLVSDPEIVEQNYKYYKLFYAPLFKTIKNMTGQDSELLLSNRKNKKYMVFNGFTYSHFGDLRYQDYTKHKDEARRMRYLKRFNKVDDHNPFSPYSLSYYLLW